MAVYIILIRIKMKVHYLLNLLTLLNTLRSYSIASDFTIEMLSKDNFSLKYCAYENKQLDDINVKYYNIKRTQVDNIVNLPIIIKDITQNNIEISDAYIDAYNSELCLNNFAINKDVNALRFINNNSNLKSILINCADGKQNLQNQSIYCTNLQSISVNSFNNSPTMPKLGSLITKDKMIIYINGFAEKI